MAAYDGALAGRPPPDRTDDPEDAAGVTHERIKLLKSWEHSGFNVNASVRIGADDATGREKMPLGPAPLSDDTPTARAMRANWARYIKKVFAADPLICPDCGGAMRIVAFIEDQCVVRAILVHLSLWDEARPPPVTPGAAPHASTELEYLPWVE